MCKMDQNTFVLRGISHTAPYTHVVRKYRKDGVLLHSWLSRCDHDWSIGIQSILIGVTNFIVESCPKGSRVLRLLTRHFPRERCALDQKVPCLYMIGRVVTFLDDHWRIQGARPARAPPKGPNSFVLTYKFYEM